MACGDSHTSTERSGRSRLASEPARWLTCWRLRRWR
jgi:hypothetical protein